MRKALRNARALQRQQEVATTDVAGLVLKGSSSRYQKRARPYSWSHLAGRQQNVLIQYASLVYFSGARRASQHGADFVADHKLSGLEMTKVYLVVINMLDVLFCEDRPESLWACGVGEALARFAYGYEMCLADYYGPPSSSNKPDFSLLDVLRVDKSHGKLSSVDQEVKKALKLNKKA